MAEICSICEGAGLRVVERDGRRFAEDCVCRVAQRAERRLKQANIPPRYAMCSLASYETMQKSCTESLKNAFRTAERFAAGYPFETEGKGLLFTGSHGVGKTHLAVGILKSLITERGATGIFWEHKRLLERLRGIYSLQAAGAEEALIRSVVSCDILVLDDLGDITPSDWSWDTTSYILNSRYNESLTTIITTNLRNEGPAIRTKGETVDNWASQARNAMTRETLGDRIGERMRSRLQEMCVVVEMQGEDFRQKVKRASFA